MRYLSPLLLSVLLALLPATGCVDVDVPAGESAVYETVYLETGEPPVRASLEDGGRVLWDPGDKIDVFTSNGGEHIFTALTGERSAWTRFSGEVPVGTSLEGAWAVYPGALYSSIFSGALSSVTVQLDSVQTAVAGAFPDGGIISFAKVSGNTLNFKHLCGGVKFRLTQEGINSVTIRSRGGVALAGIARVLFSNGAPQVSSFVRKAVSVTLKAPDGECLLPGVWYYVSCLPAEMPKGVDIILHKGDMFSSEGKDAPVKFSSGKVGRADSLDIGMIFEHVPILEKDVDEVEFATAGGEASFCIMSTSAPEVTADAGWVSVTAPDKVSEDDGVMTWRVGLTADANTLDSNRQCAVRISSSDAGSLSLAVIQRHGYESSDYSLDGRVTLLQSATCGLGIDLVVVGDAFTDRLVADGTSRRWLEAAVEGFFDVEPYASFRQCFNVYMVDAVSRNEEYGARMSHALESYYDNSVVKGSLQAAYTYACKAVKDVDETTVLVVMNSPRYGGVAYTAKGVPGPFASGFGVGFVPHCSDAAGMGRLVHHEVCGHAFAKLEDEYHTNSSSVPASAVAQKKSEYDEFGWWCNVDFSNDPAAVKWSAFISDPRYSSEGLGVFEGCMTYARGAWRPSQTSIMDNNYGTFNAPSREMIYKRIRHLSEGPDWQYSFEEFVEFDLGR